MIAPTKLENLFNFKETSSEWRLRMVACGCVILTSSFVTPKMNSELNPFDLEGHYFSRGCIEEHQGIFENLLGSGLMCVLFC